MKLPDPLHLPETRLARARAILLLAGVCFLAGAPIAQAAVETPTQSSIQQGSAQQGSIDQGSTEQKTSTEPAENTEITIESAASKADSTGRTVAMSLIGLALAIASIVLAFRRDFKEAAGVFVVGIVAVLLATPAGLKLLEATSTSLFG